MALAAGGFSVSLDEEQQVQIGMSPAEVQQVIGQPSRKVKYRNEPGPTWTYSVNGIGDSLNPSLFEVNFDANGRVVSFAERVIDNTIIDHGSKD